MYAYKVREMCVLAWRRTFLLTLLLTEPRPLLFNTTSRKCILLSSFALYVNFIAECLLLNSSKSSFFNALTNNYESIIHVTKIKVELIIFIYVIYCTVIFQYYHWLINCLEWLDNLYMHLNIIVYWSKAWWGSNCKEYYLIVFIVLI